MHPQISSALCLVFLVTRRCQGFTLNKSKNSNKINIVSKHNENARTSISSELYATTEAGVDGEEKEINVPFFASALGGAHGSFFSSTPASSKSGGSSEGKAASITTRVPLGTLFDSREYIFETVTNVR